MNRLQSIVRAIKEHDGVVQKSRMGSQLGSILMNFSTSRLDIGPGDDAGAIASNDGFLLMTNNGVPSSIIKENPRCAGKVAIFLNANNIAATGGYPIAVTDALFGTDEETTLEIMSGLSEGCHDYGIPLLGGHFDPGIHCEALCATMTGKATSLIKGSGMRPGDIILAAMDLRGKRISTSDYLVWNSNVNRVQGDIWKDITLIPFLDQEGLVRCCKDIGSGGIVGTVAMMAEASGVGCSINLNEIPRPGKIFSVESWVNVLPSFGFILATHHRDTERIMEIFSKRGIACAIIGQATIGGVVELELEKQREVLFDFKKEHLLGWKP